MRMARVFCLSGISMELDDLENEELEELRGLGFSKSHARHGRS